MIVRDRPNWLRLLFVWRGSILPQLLAALGFAVLVTLVHGQVWRWKVPLNFVPFSLIGLALAIFLGFRNGTSYSRWWEARVLWGQLLIASRAAVRQALTLGDGVQGDATVPARSLIALAHALRHQLRGGAVRDDMARLLPADEAARVAAARYPAAALLQMAGEWLGELRRQGRIAPALVPGWRRNSRTSATPSAAASGWPPRRSRSPTASSSTARFICIACCCRLGWSIRSAA